MGPLPRLRSSAPEPPKARRIAAAALALLTATLGGCGGGDSALSGQNLCLRNWGPPTFVETGPLLPRPPRAVIDRTGVATLLWDVYIGSPAVFVPHASRSASGSNWTPPANLESTPATVQSFVLALVESGSYPFAVWLNQDSPTAAVLRSAEFVTSWSTPITLPAQGVSDAVAFASNADGASVGVRAEPDGADNYRLVAARRFAAGAWSAPVVVDAALPLANLVDVSPSIAIDTLGEAVVTWIGSESLLRLERRVFASHLPVGAATWTSPTPIDTPVGSSFQTKVVALGSGRFLAAWIQSVAGHYSLYANSFAGAAWQQNPDLIEDDDRGDAGMIAIAVDAAGAAQAVWLHLDENGTSRISSNRSPPRAGNRWARQSRPRHLGSRGHTRPWRSTRAVTR